MTSHDGRPIARHYPPWSTVLTTYTLATVAVLAAASVVVVGLSPAFPSSIAGGFALAAPSMLASAVTGGLMTRRRFPPAASVVASALTAALFGAIVALVVVVPLSESDPDALVDLRPLIVLGGASLMGCAGLIAGVTVTRLRLDGVGRSLEL